MFSRIFGFTTFQLQSGVKTWMGGALAYNAQHKMAETQTQANFQERKNETQPQNNKKAQFVNGTPDGKLNQDVVKAKKQEPVQGTEDLSSKTTLTVGEARQLNEQVRTKREKENQVNQRWGGSENEVFLENKLKNGTHTEKVQASAWILKPEYGMKLGDHHKHGIAGVDKINGKDTKSAVEAFRQNYNKEHPTHPLKTEKAAEDEMIKEANKKVDQENQAYGGYKRKFLKETLNKDEGHKPMQAGLTLLGYGDTLGDPVAKKIDGKWGPKTGLGVGKFVNDYNSGKFNALEGKPADWRPHPLLSQPQDAEKKIVELGQKKIALNEKGIEEKKSHHTTANHPHVKPKAPLTETQVQEKKDKIKKLAEEELGIQNFDPNNPDQMKKLEAYLESVQKLKTASRGGNTIQFENAKANATEKANALGVAPEITQELGTHSFTNWNYFWEGKIGKKANLDNLQDWDHLELNKNDVQVYAAWALPGESISLSNVKAVQKFQPEPAPAPAAPSNAVADAGSPQVADPQAEYEAYLAQSCPDSANQTACISETFSQMAAYI